MRTTRLFRSFDYGDKPKLLQFTHSKNTKINPKQLDDAMRIMTPFISAERMATFRKILESRCFDVKLLYENPANPSNVYACLRTLDSFGLQHVDITDGMYREPLGKAGDNTGLMRKKKNKLTAVGSDKWLSVKQWDTTKTPLAEIIRNLKKEGYKVYTTSLEGGTDVREFPFRGGEEKRQKMVICFGNEETGVTDELKGLSDGLFYLPMFGFAESYNLSVATSLTCAYMLEGGVIRPSGVEAEEERRRVMGEWMIRSFPKRGMAEMILEREGIELGTSLHALDDYENSL
ncbi:hypothetical protein TL16_g04772 [Triparma laevis f. inornata]|uniref:tRNA/rRNA methyltransferase SpoU type domain-containing protein n=1 Tax=Triparma laevis f. inornata TaxID=1714386 RepID=A0A9W7ABU9_9STRA|nr:hypothetical protein TL16_g04772 [Triparma laevis f. inornata]